ncbi:MAG: T9SS type A sorting domain-containing protein, partial [Bacteroidales bacterium]|nr:T9SS type A sorting domain-containing protein [Bacteroidales bacterium]
QSIIFLSIVVLISLNVSNNASAQNRELNIPEVQYTELEDYYNTGAEIACTARVYSNGLIDNLCAIYYEIYKDDFDTPITSVGTYGSISYTVRSQGTSHITEDITNGSGYLSVKPLFTTYTAFTLGIFDNYCTNRNRPVALSMRFNEPGVYKFNAEIQSCTNSGSTLWTDFDVAASAPEACVPGTHKDYAASTCSNPTALFSEAIFLTICNNNFIEFLSGANNYCPSEEINIVYNIGEYDDSVDMALLPAWISPVIDQNANTLTLTGNAPSYDSENPTINFDVRILSTLNPAGCPGDTINQSITITNSQTPVISGDNMICEGGTVILTSDIAATWSSSDTEIATIEQTAPDTEVTVISQNSGTIIITCQITDNECDVNSNNFIFNVNAHYEITLLESICNGEVYSFGVDNLDTAGDYNINTTSQYGCDSIVHLTLQVNELSSSEFYIEDESYTWNEIEYTESGDYVQTFSDVNDCDSTVTLHLTIVTDITSSSFVKETIDIYPNPVSESLHIDITKENNTVYSIILTDITGKVLIKKDHASENNILDLSQISGGIYFISVMSDNKIIFTNMINKE